MEGLPFKLSATLILAAIIISIAFLQLQTFTEFTERKQFADDLARVRDALRVVSTSGSYGSFTRVDLRIPHGSSVTFDNSTNKMAVDFYGEPREYSVPGQLVLYRVFEPADYKIVIYYGLPANSSDPLTVAIK